MPAVALYFVVAAILIQACRRSVVPVSRTAALLLLLFPICFTGRALLTGRVYAPIDLPYMSEPLLDHKSDYGIDQAYNPALSDLPMQMIPWRRAVRESLAARQWPLWNRHMFTGNVLAGNMQSAPYDPLHLVGGLLSQAQALTFDAAMALFCAGLFTFLFARTLSLGEPASLIAAAGYMCSGMLAFFIAWPLGRAWVLLPLLLVGVRLVVHDAGVRATAILSTALVLIVLAGHPESVLHLVFVGVLYGVFELSMKPGWRAVWLASAAGVIALLLTAISLLPFLAAAPQTAEYHIRKDLYATTPFEAPADKVWSRAAMSLWPFVGGQPERRSQTPRWEPTTLRVGSIVLALALAAIVLAPRPATWFFLGLAAFAALAGLNAFPVAHLLHALPVFNMAINERLAMGAAFALAMLAAIAVDAIGAREGGERLPTRARLVVGSVWIGLAIGATLLVRSQIDEGVPASQVALLAAAGLVPLGIVALVLTRGVSPRVALPLVLGLVLLQRTVEDGSIYPAIPDRAFYPDIPILGAMQQDTETPFRMVGLHYAFLPDAAALYGLEDARGYEAMTFKRLADTFPLWALPLPVWFNNVFDKTRPFLSMINIKYAIAKTTEPPDAQWTIVLDDRDSRLLRNTRVLPRAFVPRRIRFESVDQRVLDGMSGAADFGEVSWITAAAGAHGEHPNGPGTLTIRRLGHGYEIDATMAESGWAVVSESAWPGWQASIDGTRVPTAYANHAFIGVFVPRGTHLVRLRYLPDAFSVGRGITLATMAGLVVFFVVARYRSRASIASRFSNRSDAVPDKCAGVAESDSIR